MSQRAERLLATVSSCAACWQDFASGSDLEAHIRTCHPERSDMPFLVASRPQRTQGTRNGSEGSFPQKPANYA